jgi:hypothetical protein
MSHLGLFSGSSSAYTNSASTCSKSYDFVSKLRTKVEFECVDSSSQTGGRKKVPACGSCGARERLSSN